ncbi:hypothetical protein CBR_g54906 [Chara braunii]|uniref:Uncharacterized protein n=1 Tax=Chara braunii TaxID=69332 RepID=A0A388JPS8_CHABU|nr:hypothetical protein CBR_g54906 [Chara braunii]|eukprot:GBG59804.1 hypothetical protein CBR_g54906 [Chara braunii]
MRGDHNRGGEKVSSWGSHSPRIGRRSGRQDRGDDLEERDQVRTVDIGGILSTGDVGEEVLPVGSQRQDDSSIPEIGTSQVPEAYQGETGSRGCDRGGAPEADGSTQPTLIQDGEEASLQLVLTTVPDQPTRIDTSKRAVSDTASEDRRDRPYRWRDTQDTALDLPQGELQLMIEPATIGPMQEHEGPDLTSNEVEESDPQCHQMNMHGPNDRRCMREDTLRNVIWPRYEQHQHELELRAASERPQVKVLAHGDGAHEGPQPEQVQETTLMHGELGHRRQRVQPQSEPAMEDGERGARGPSSLDGLSLLSESRLVAQPTEIEGSLTAQLYDMESPRMQVQQDVSQPSAIDIETEQVEAEVMGLGTETPTEGIQTWRVESSPLDFGATPQRDGGQRETSMRGQVEAGPEHTQDAFMTHEEESWPEFDRSRACQEGCVASRGDGTDTIVTFSRGVHDRVVCPAFQVDLRRRVVQFDGQGLLRDMRGARLLTRRHGVKRVVYDKLGLELRRMSDRLHVHETHEVSDYEIKEKINENEVIVTKDKPLGSFHIIIFYFEGSKAYTCITA